ncbi:BppU family phage baseplate upper protein [Clostridium perfringens]|uniref:BppU family phage baseplate upper protein n=1 Tax=Clostridium perfringens TaxID=1502 RepID=UPI0039EA8146
MNEIGLNINVDSYNNEGIKTIKGNNNAEIYKLYILKNKRRLSLVGKTVKLGYVMSGTKNGDVINLNITNAEQGEITFPITNSISKRDGVYSCQLAILGADGFLEHTATFGLTVEANIFTKIAVEIADSKDFTYLENILDKASKLSEKLKENTSSANNANSNLESNITEANNINSKLLENTSTATSLNKNLESNIDLAKEVKETIKDLDAKNTEATSNIGQLTNLNAKATELSNNIQQGLPLNAELVKNTESAKAANTNLAATNQEATTKNTELQASLEKTKKFIDGLDGSQNIPQIRMDVTELQNGLKSNQALAYKGFSVVADNTLEGRTEGMKIEGKTMYEKADGTYTDTWEEGVTLESFGEKEGNKISILSHGKNLTNFENPIVDMNGTTHKLLDNGIKVTSSSDNHQMWCFSMLRVSVKENTDYYCSFKYKTMEEGVGWIAIRTTNDVLIKDFGLHEGVFNSGHNKEVVVQFYASLGTPIINNTVEYYDFQIEEGTSKTPYEPYKQDKKDILIKEPLRESDIMYEDNGKVKVYRPTKQYTFTGNENWIKALDNEEEFKTIHFQINLDDSYDFILNKAEDVLSNNFPSVGSLWSKDVEGIYKYSNNNLTISILKTKLTTPTVEGLKAWLKANPTTVIYQLATPTVEIVENCVDIDLDTFGEKTYFNILNSLPGTLDFKVPSNIGSVVQNMAKEVNNIWDVINNLLVPSLIDINKNVAMSTIKNNLK